MIHAPKSRSIKPLVLLYWGLPVRIPTEWSLCRWPRGRDRGGPWLVRAAVLTSEPPSDHCATNQEVVADKADHKDDRRHEPHLDVRVERPVVKEHRDEHGEWEVHKVDPERSFSDVRTSRIDASAPPARHVKLRPVALGAANERNSKR